MNVASVVDAAVYAALNVSSVTSIATGGVHNRKAPPQASGTWIVFRRVTSPDEIRTLIAANGDSGRIVPLRYQVQGITQGLSAAAAESALAAADDVLDDVNLVLSAGTFLGCRRQRFLDALTDDLAGGLPYQITGAHYLIEVQVP